MIIADKLTRELNFETFLPAGDNRNLIMIVKQEKVNYESIAEKSLEFKCSTDVENVGILILQAGHTKI